MNLEVPVKHKGRNPYMGQGTFREFWFDMRHPVQLWFDRVPKGLPEAWRDFCGVLGGNR